MTTAVTRKYDVVVIGGGPAGTTTALMLRQHCPTLTVAVVERSAYNEARVGESVPPLLQPLLEQLQLWAAFKQRGYVPAYGTCAAWGSHVLHTNPFLYQTHSRGWHLDRCDFDAWLADKAVRRGVSLYTLAQVQGRPKRRDGRWALTLSAPDQAEVQLEATFVVDATGRQAQFARWQGASKILFDRLVGVSLFFQLKAGTPDTYTMVEAAPDGWWYSALLPGQQVVVAWMSDADLVKQHGLKAAAPWLACVRKTHHTQARLGQAVPLADPVMQAAHTHLLDKVVGDGWLAVGDAAAALDPLSSQGIFQAMRAGIMAAYAIGDHLAGDASGLAKYEVVVKEMFAHYWPTWVRYYHQERRWPEAVFWRRRNGRVTLDPMQRLYCPQPERRIRWGHYVSRYDLQRLVALCQPPRLAHEVVARFKTQVTQPPADGRLILGLQYLIEQGILVPDQS